MDVTVTYDAQSEQPVADPNPVVVGGSGGTITWSCAAYPITDIDFGSNHPTWETNGAPAEQSDGSWQATYAPNSSLLILEYHYSIALNVGGVIVRHDPEFDEDPILDPGDS